MADFRQLAEFLRRLAPGMARAGGSRVPPGVGQIRAGQMTGPMTATSGAAMGGMRPDPAAVQFFRQLNRETLGRETLTDNDALAALAYELGLQYGPFRPKGRP